MRQSQSIRKLAEVIGSTSSSSVMKTKIAPKLNQIASMMKSFEQTLDITMPEDTPARHIKRILKNGEQLLQTSQRIDTELLNTVSASMQELKNTATDKARLSRSYYKSDPEEIRRVVRELPFKKRHEIVNEKDPEVISALIGQHPILHGVKDQHLNDITNTILEAAAPQEMAELKELEGFIETREMINNEIKSFITEVNSNKQVQKTLDQAETAENLHNNFINALRGEIEQ